MTDEIGIMQHASGFRPDPAHGYCTDDVARALQVDLLHATTIGWAAVSASVRRNLAFLDLALDRRTGRFRNFRLADGSWVAQAGSEDCHGRAMLALGEAMRQVQDGTVAAFAERLFNEGLPATARLGALRATASALLGCDAAMQAAPTEDNARMCRQLGGRLRASFAGRPASRWHWPETRLTYENALPARALVVAGHHLGSQPTMDAGLGILDWLIELQTADAGHLAPVSNGWWSRGGLKPRFDQQPIEAGALLPAVAFALGLTRAEHYRAAAERAYGWFLGANDLGTPVADPASGACHDGLTATGVNANCGAESTLMWQIALEHIRAVRRSAAPPLRVGSPHLAATPA